MATIGDIAAILKGGGPVLPENDRFVRVPLDNGKTVEILNNPIENCTILGVHAASGTGTPAESREALLRMTFDSSLGAGFVAVLDPEGSVGVCAMAANPEDAGPTLEALAATLADRGDGAPATADETAPAFGQWMRI